MARGRAVVVELFFQKPSFPRILGSLVSGLGFRILVSGLGFRELPFVEECKKSAGVSKK